MFRFRCLRVSGTINSAAGIGPRLDGSRVVHRTTGADQVGWDWFSVQLDNSTELMLFELRRKDGSIDPVFIRHVHRCAGRREASAHGKILRCEPLAYWHKYPVEWRMRVPSLNIDLTSRAVMPDQELRAKQRRTGLLGRRGGLFRQPERRRDIWK